MTKPSTSADRFELMETFVRIVEAGNLSAAAAQLGTTQPTVSRRLQALERSLGVKLLSRSTHSMTLTEDGQRCLERARELLAELARIRGRPARRRRRARGHAARHRPARVRPAATGGAAGRVPGALPAGQRRVAAARPPARLHRRGHRLRDPGRPGGRPGGGRDQARRGAAHRRGGAVACRRPAAGARARATWPGCRGCRCGRTTAPRWR